MSKQESTVREDNIYKLDGRVPVAKALPFAIQHVMAMFVANVTPIIIIAGLAVYNGVAFTETDIAVLIQNCMLIAGIGTIIQLFPIWRIGSGLPVVMGLSFTFLAVCTSSASQDYSLMIGGVLVGGCIEGLLGLTAKYWKKFIQPIVIGCVVISIGLSVLNVGVSSFASSGAYPVGAWQNLLVGTITLVSCLAFNVFAKGFLKQLSVLFGLLVGYIVAIPFGMVDFSTIQDTVQQLGVFALPRVFAYTPKFDIGVIVSFTIVFLVSAVETIGDTTAVCTGALGRDITGQEVSGSLAVDGFVSAIAGGIFGVSPITSFSQNVGLLKMTKVVNKFTIMIAALIMIAGGLFPPIGAFLATLPDCVLGGCTIMMFGSIVFAGIEMTAKAGFNYRNMVILAISICLGVGATQVEGFFSGLPPVFGTIFGENLVASVFVVALILSFVLPKNMGEEK